MRLNQKGALAYLITFLVLVVLISGFLYFRKFYSPSSKVDSQSLMSQKEVKTYTNTKYGFSVQYPSTLIVREFPDTQDGAGFRPVNTADDPSSEAITVSVLQKNADLVNDPLSEYAKVAASSQIQNYQKLNTIEAVKTQSGVIGYKTTWDVLPLAILGASPSAQTRVSLPITYFDLKESYKSLSVQLILEDAKYENEYEEMIRAYTIN